jgi:GxxExxY protein
LVEPVYQEALGVELAQRSIPSHAKLKLPVSYKGALLDASYIPDFICFDAVVVELKALSRLSSIEEAQVINYLKVTGLHTGLLLNFGSQSLEKRRFVLTWRNFESAEICEICGLRSFVSLGAGMGWTGIVGWNLRRKVPGVRTDPAVRNLVAAMRKGGKVSIANRIARYVEPQIR